MSHHAYSYDANGNITRIDLGAEGTARDAWTYVYDALNRLTRETRLAVASGGQETTRWYRDYAYDPAGNRTAMTWFDGSQSRATTYAYNALNQLTGLTPPAGSLPETMTFDSRGNLTGRFVGPPPCTNWWTYEWTVDNRLSRAGHYTSAPTLIDVEYAYDHQGARVLKRRLLENEQPDGTRTRYFFHGLTEEVVKRSVAGVHTDTAFELLTRENGETAAGWAVYDADPAGASVASVADTTRHPDGVGRVIHCPGQNGNGFVCGDNDADSYNPNAVAWNDTRRVLSFWFKGGFSPAYVCVSTSAGARQLRYYTLDGTDFVDGGGNVCVYLGAAAGSGSQWRRFERDVAADWQRVTGGATSWQNTDGILWRPTAAANYHLWVDDVRFSNAMTVERNSLLPGAVGHIACARSWTPGTGGNGATGHADRFYFYDHIGNVQGVSAAGGSVAETYTQDAWGNVLSSATTGQWATSFAGRYSYGFEYEVDCRLYKHNSKLYQSESGRYIHRNSPYTMPGNNPVAAPPWTPPSPGAPSCLARSGCIYIPMTKPLNCHKCNNIIGELGIPPAINCNLSCPGPGGIDHSFSITATGFAISCYTSPSPNAEGGSGVCVCYDNTFELFRWARSRCGNNLVTSCAIVNVAPFPILLPIIK